MALLILKVGGDDAAAACLREALGREPQSWRFEHVPTLGAALHRCEAELPGLVLVHHQLPDGDGMALLHHLSDVPLILSIGLGEEAVAAQALDLGFADYVIEDTSPAYAQVMLAQVKAALRHRQLGVALGATEARLAAIIDGTRAGTWEWNIATDEVLVNDRFAALVGRQLQELPCRVGALYELLLHPADEAPLAEANRQHLEGLTDYYECEFRFKHKRGHWVWLHERGRINHRDAQGRPLVMSGTTTDVTANRYAEDALRVTSELLKDRTHSLETTLQSIGQGLLVVGADGRVSLYNERTCHLLDLPDTLLASRPMLSEVVYFQMRRGDFGPGFDLVETSARDYVASGCSLTEGGGPPVFVRRTPQNRVLEIKSNPLPGGGFVRTFTDVTPYVEALDALRERGEEIHRLNETLEQRVAHRTADLERSMRDIEALSYSIAHDLRGPLRAVNGFAALIAAEEAERLSDDGRQLFGRIVDASRHMGVVITDLLDLFKVVRAELTPVRVDVVALAQEAVRALMGPYPRTEVVIGPMPLALGDATMLRHLVHNLLDNALKYSSKAEAPVVEMGWCAQEQAWFVRDNGVGFDLTRADKLFGLFQRFHAPADFSGSGVGLAVAARIVQRHEGRLWAESAPGAGATFWFTLAFETAQAPY